MRQHRSSPVPRFLTQRIAEVYCRRDNRVYPHCPHAETGQLCPCLHGVETADSLFEPGALEDESRS